VETRSIPVLFDSDRRRPIDPTIETISVPDRNIVTYKVRIQQPNNVFMEILETEPVFQ